MAQVPGCGAYEVKSVVELAEPEDESFKQMLHNKLMPVSV